MFTFGVCKQNVAAWNSQFKYRLYFLTTISISNTIWGYFKSHLVLPWYNITKYQQYIVTYWIYVLLFSRFEKQTAKLMKANERQQLPLSTILVRWIYSPCQQPFTLDSIWYVMSRFGHITHLQYISPSSAIVVYENITAACNAISTKYLHTTQNRLRCHWYHKEMKNKLFRSTGSRLKVVTDKFI